MFINYDETHRDHPEGYPDPSGDHFGNALATAYAEGASKCGNEVNIIGLAKIDFRLLRTKEDFEKGAPPDSIRLAQETISRADHLLIIPRRDHDGDASTHLSLLLRRAQLEKPQAQ